MYNATNNTSNHRVSSSHRSIMGLCLVLANIAQPVLMSSTASAADRNTDASKKSSLKNNKSSQSKNNRNTIVSGATNKSNKRVLLSNTGSDALQSEYDFGSYVLMGESAIDPNHNGLWDTPEVTRQWVDTYLAEDFAGYLVLDNEGVLFDRINAGPQSQGWKESVLDAIAVVEAIHDWRPNAKVGYYGLPLREYWNQTEEWENNARALAPLWDAVDFVAPSCYEFYVGENHEPFINMVKLSLEVANDKPVLLFVWHRYHTSVEHGYQLIPEQEYVDHIKALMNVEHHGRRPAGVLHWGSDAYDLTTLWQIDEYGDFIRQGVMEDRMRDAMNAESVEGEDDDKYLDRINRRALRLTAEAINDEPVDRDSDDDPIIDSCLEDVSSPVDGQVNAMDLLAILADWDTEDSPADVDQSGTVDVADLLAVINAWGPCSQDH